MGTSDTLTKLADGAYAAALDSRLWQPWAADMVDAMGGTGGALHIFDDSSEHKLFDAVNLDPAIIDDFALDPISRHDPQIGFALSRTASMVYVDTDHVDRRNPVAVRYMAAVEALTGWRHHLTALAVIGDGSIRAALSIHRKAADGTTPDAVQAQLTALLPGIAAALALGLRHGEALTGAFWDGISVMQGSAAMALLDETGRVMRTTAALDQMMRTGDGLTIAQARLRAANPADDTRLEARTAQAVTRAGASAGAVRIARRSGRAAYVATIFPLPKGQRILAPFEAAALVTILDPAADVPAPAHLYRSAFGLTPRETEVAALLMAGHSVESLAAALTLSVPTARVHLRGLLAKTGTSRQTDLVRLLGRF